MNNESLLFKQSLHEERVCKNHLILGQHLYKNLEGHDFDLYGGAKFRSKGNKVRLSPAINYETSIKYVLEEKQTF